MIGLQQSNSIRSHEPISVVRHRVVEFLKSYCVIRSECEAIVSSSGRATNWLLDTRIALLNPEMSNAIAVLFWDYLETLFPFQLSCLELTGVPLMIAVQAHAMRLGYPVNGLIIRKESKPIGRRRQIEGTMTDLPIVFLDDILNSGDSIRRASAALALHARQISQVVALVDFDTQPIGEALLRNGIDLKSLVKLSELGVIKSRASSDRGYSVSQIFEEIWTFPADCGPSFDLVPKSTPAIDGESIYLGSDSGMFYALNRTTGEVRWSFATGSRGPKGIRSSPIVEKDLVYFGAYDGVLYALDSSTGKTRWQYSDADWIGSSPCISQRCHSIYVGLEHALQGRRGGLVALDCETGERRWEFVIPGLVHSSPAYIHDLDVVVVGSHNGSLYCVSASEGRLQWEFATEGAIKCRPYYDSCRRMVIFGSFDKSVYSCDAHTGGLLWRSSTDGIVYSEQLVIGDYVYICSTDKYLHIIEAANGASVECLHLSAKLFSSPAFCNNRLYFASTSGAVYEFDVQARRLTGSHFFSERITNKVLYEAESRMFYISTIDARLIACRRRNDISGT